MKKSRRWDDGGWQLVRIEDTPHTTGEIVNPKTVSIEYEQLEGQAIPDIAYTVLAQTWWEAEQYVVAHGLGDFSEAIKGHKTWVGDNRVCPDGISMTRVVAEWQALRTPAPPADDRILVTGNPFGAFGFRLGFRAWAETIGRARNPADVTAGILSVTGWPKGDEYPVQGGSVQECERLNLLYRAVNQPPWDIVVARCDDPLPERTA